MTDCVTLGSGFEAGVWVARPGGVVARLGRLPLFFCLALVVSQFLPHSLSAASSCRGVDWSQTASSGVADSCRAALAVKIWVIVRVGRRGAAAVWLDLVSPAWGIVPGVRGTSSSQCSAARVSTFAACGGPLPSATRAVREAGRAAPEGTGRMEIPRSSSIARAGRPGVLGTDFFGR